MFGLFKSKLERDKDKIRKIARQMEQSGRILYMKSNEAAFEYACKFMNTELGTDAFFVGYVISENPKGDAYRVIRANPETQKLTPEVVEGLKNDYECKYLTVSALPMDTVPHLKQGDLVAFYPLPGMERFGGTIISKLLPAIEPVQGTMVPTVD